jgi:predicted DNA-binding protein (MmcQ/YjbR family)
MKKPVAKKSAKKPAAKKASAKQTPHEKAEKDLTAFALTLPESDAGLAWPPTRAVRVKGKMFCVFGNRGEPVDELTIILKLPVAAEMVQELYFVQESKGWFKQHNWVIAHFNAEDDILGEMDTIKAWVIQSYCAMAPRKLSKLVMAERDRNEGKAF